MSQEAPRPAGASSRAAGQWKFLRCQVQGGKVELLSDSLVFLPQRPEAHLNGSRFFRRSSAFHIFLALIVDIGFFPPGSWSCYLSISFGGAPAPVPESSSSWGHVISGGSQLSVFYIYF